MENNKKNTLTLTIIAIAVLLVAVVGATFAYFRAQVDSGTSVNVQVTSQSTDQLTFTANALTVGPANQTNFGQNAGNLSDTKTGTATLTANTSASATYCYTVGLTVSSNNFQYTTAPTNTPELLLSASKNGTPVLTNYDITTMTTGTVSFPTTSGGNVNTHSITATANNTTTDTWSITVTFVNLASDQSLQGTGQVNNLDKTFSGQIVFTKVACS